MTAERILNDPVGVREEYASERRLLGRRAAYADYPTTGPDSIAIAVEAVAAAHPRRVLEVGCGTGDLGERIAKETRSDVVATDLSLRMVELTRSRGLEAREADVQELPFGDGEFDCAVAAWMLYHVPDVDRGLAELARVLRPGGRLVAVTNALDHLRELRELVGLGPRLATPFSAEKAEELLARHFARVRLHDAGGTVQFPDRAAVEAYVAASPAVLGRGRGLPDGFEGPLMVTRHPVVLVADKA